MTALLVRQPPKDRRIGLRAPAPNPPRDTVRVFADAVRVALRVTVVRPVDLATALLSPVRNVLRSFLDLYKG